VGVKLVAEVLDTAPADLGPVERLLLVVLAEAANDSTREAWPGMEVIVRRVGRSKARVRAAFAALAKRGLDPRVPLGEDKNGRPFFSARGMRTTYRIPDLKGASTPGAIPSGKASERLAPFPAERRQDAERLSGEKGARRPNRKVLGVQTERCQDAWHPSLKEPSKNPHTPTATAPKETPPTATGDEWMPEATRIVLDGLRADHPAATVDDARAVHRLVVERYGSKANLTWLRTMASNRSFTPFYADVKAARAEQVERQIREIQRTNPPCEHDMPAGRIPHPTTGLPLCPMCRDGRPPLRRNGEQTHPDVLAALNAYRTHANGRISVATLMRITQEAIALHRRHVPADHLVALAEKAARINTGLLEAATQ